MKKIVLLCLIILSFPSFSQEISYVAGSGVVYGKVLGQKGCLGKEVQVFFVHQNIVNYQIPVPAGGDFQVHLIPGDYKVVAVDEGGCLSSNQLTIKADQLVRQTIQMEKVSSDKKVSLFNFFIPQAEAMTMCIQCLHSQFAPGQPNFGGYFGGYPTQRFGYPTAYWGPFGHFSFNRFSSPCPMGGLGPYAYAVVKQQKRGRAPAGLGFGSGMAGGFSSGCLANRYPGGGPIAMGKPITYFYGKKGQKVSVNLKMKENGNILATTPSLTTNGVSLEVVGDGSVKKDQVIYPYFFYDVRTEGSRLQSKSGSCVPGKEVVKTMVGYLSEAGFNSKEIKDFYSYWNVKLPKLKRVCIYPQTTEHLIGMHDLVLSPKPDIHTRLMFVLVPIINGVRPKKLFSKAPEIEWSGKRLKKTASPNQFVVREWGVGFLTVPEEEGKSPKVSLKTLKL